MDFTPLVPCSRRPSVACGIYIATICPPSKVIVRSSTSLSIKRVIAVDASFSIANAEIQWGISTLDGHHRILLANSQRVLAWDIDNEEWALDISEGLGGVRHVEWSSTAEEILIWAQFQLKLTVWSVAANAGTILPNPKLLARGFHARPGRQQAILMQRTSQDILSLIDITTSDWRLQKSFALATIDAQGARWSPDGRWIVVWDHVLDYKVLIYTPDGRLVRSFVAYDVGLGVKTVAWSPTTEYLAIGSFDDKVRLLNTTSFSPCMELSHTSTIKNDRASVWRQVQSGTAFKHERAESAISLPVSKSGPNDFASRHGISTVLFSPNGFFLATLCDRLPTTLWIWSLREFSPVAILVQNDPIRHIQWMPDEAGQLVFTCQASCATDNNALYLWNIDWECPRIMSVPRDGFEIKWFSVVEQNELREEPCGILIGGEDAFTIGYTVPENEFDAGATQMSVLEEEAEEGDMRDSKDSIQQYTGDDFGPQSSVIIHDVAHQNFASAITTTTQAML